MKKTQNKTPAYPRGYQGMIKYHDKGFIEGNTNVRRIKDTEGGWRWAAVYKGKQEGEC